MPRRMAGWFLARMWIFVLLAMSLSVAQAAQRGVKVVAKTPEGKEIPLYRNSYALVIGNGAYTNGWDPLTGAIRDVEDVGAALGDNGFEVMLRRNLTRSQFDKVFGTFVLKYGGDPKNRLLFYYAGHGYTEKIATDETMGYLVMVDAPPPENRNVDFYLCTVDMQTVVTQAKRIRARHVLFMFDSCFSGSILNLRERVVPETISDSVRLPVRQFITAGRADEPVPDHSIFKVAFLDVLLGRVKDPIPDGYLTGEELGLYLKTTVPNYNPAQHPQYGKIRDIRLDKGDFVFELASSGAVVSRPVPQRPRKTTLSVQANVDGARVVVDGRSVGTTPLLDHPVKAARHRVMVEKEGYEPYRDTVDVEKGRSVTLRVILDADKPWTARLYVDAEPSDARVRIMNIGPVFYQGMELDPGSYDVAVSREGYETERQWVELAAGEDERLTVKLRPVSHGPARAGETWREPATGMEFVWVPGGCFQMGQTRSEKQYLMEEAGEETYRKYFGGERPRHRVCVDGFWMGKTEVTRGEFREFVRETGYRTDAEKKGRAFVRNRETDWEWKELSGYDWEKVGYEQNERHPVTCVSWNDARAFAGWLSKKSGRKMRLPREAEWEYAARGGEESMRFWGSRDSDACRYANVADEGHSYSPSFPCDDGYQFTAPVGHYKPNPFGLYDILGNVWEWCEDWYGEDYYARSPEQNPEGPADGRLRVLRGGSWDNVPWRVRAADRGRSAPVGPSTGRGFRVVALPRQ